MLNRNFFLVTLSDLIVRAAYQMGKTPLLPIFAAALGASDVLLGFIVSVSTLTGMALKPLFGMLSDRQGRKIWLLIGVTFFTLMPFVYWLVQTPAQLAGIRILHGTATAIYGPVTVAYVAELGVSRRAESLGWFSMARSAGYIIGPASAGWLLLFTSPQIIFSIIGAISCLAFIPILALNESQRPKPSQPPSKRMTQNLWQGFFNRLRASAAAPGVWLAGGLESFSFVSLYALKAFLPIYALDAGYNAAQAGLFFSIQQTAATLAKPLAGRLGDKFGELMAIFAGMSLIGLGLYFLPSIATSWQLLGIAAGLGFGEGALFPVTTALIARQLPTDNLGGGIGLVGTLQNAGKVAGPIFGGLLIANSDFVAAFRLLGLGMGLGAIALLSTVRFSSRPTAVSTD